MQERRRLAQPWLEPVPDHLRTDRRCGSALAGLISFTTLAIVAWIAIGLAAAWLGDRL